MVNFKNNSEVKILSLPAYLALGHKGFNFLNKKKEKKTEQKKKTTGIKPIFNLLSDLL